MLARVKPISQQAAGADEQKQHIDVPSVVILQFIIWFATQGEPAGIRRRRQPDDE